MEQRIMDRIVSIIQCSIVHCSNALNFSERKIWSGKRGTTPKNGPGGRICFWFGERSYGAKEHFGLFNFMPIIVQIFCTFPTMVCKNVWVGPIVLNFLQTTIISHTSLAF
jgi:hypothetical protein